MAYLKKLGLILLLLGSMAASAADRAYLRELNRWRRDGDKFMRSAASPLCVIARFTLAEGDTTIGSDAASTIVLPPQAPARLGTLHRHNSDIFFEIDKGVSVRVNGKRPSLNPGGERTHSLTLRYSEGAKPGDRVSFGQYAITIRLQGDRYMLSFWDTRSPQARQFKGVAWFPVDPAYRVTAQFIPALERDKKTISLICSDGVVKHFTVAGTVVFELAGETQHLTVYEEDAALFVMFQDASSGKQSYGGGRYLEAALPENGKTVLDFNKAYNPDCAYSHFSSCPLPQKENRLMVPILAGAAYHADNDAVSKP